MWYCTYVSSNHMQQTSAAISNVGNVNRCGDLYPEEREQTVEYFDNTNRKIWNTVKLQEEQKISPILCFMNRTIVSLPRNGREGWILISRISLKNYSIWHEKAAIDSFHMRAWYHHDRHELHQWLRQSHSKNRERREVSIFFFVDWRKDRWSQKEEWTTQCVF